MVKVLRSVVGGPLEPHIVGFAEELLRQGYSRTSAAQHVCFLAHLDRWMSAEGVAIDGLSCPVIERYLAQRRAAGYREYRSVKALRPMLDFLAPLGVLPVPLVVLPGPVEELLGRYRNYLISERGLTSETARGYVDFVRPFVVARLRGEALDFAGLTAGDVTAFVQHDPEIRRGSTVPQRIATSEREFCGLEISTALKDQAEMEGPVAVTPLGAARIGDLGRGQVPALVVGQQSQVGRGPGVTLGIGLPPRGFGASDVLFLVEQDEPLLKIDVARTPFFGARCHVIAVGRVACGAHVGQSSRLMACPRCDREHAHFTAHRYAITTRGAFAARLAADLDGTPPSVFVGAWVRTRSANRQSTKMLQPITTRAMANGIRPAYRYAQ